MVVRGRAPKQGEIIWLDFDPQAGREQAGRRPALVISRSAYNARILRASVCPITSRVKGYPFEISIHTKTVQGVALIDQLKNIDWVARKALCTGEIVPRTTLEQAQILLESMLKIGEEI